MKNSINRFGQFLIEKDVVTPAQLQEAILSQKENRLMVGQLAKAKGYMKEEDIRRVLSIQKNTKKKFGEIAISLGLLTESRLLDLLRIQSYNHIYIGDALKNLGYIEIIDLYACLDEFKYLALGGGIDISLESENIYKVDIEKKVFKLFQEFFFNEGSFTKFDASYKQLPPLHTMEIFAAEQQFSNGMRGYACLLLPKIFVVVTGGTSISKFANPVNSDEFMEMFSELVWLQNYSICRYLEAFGYKIKPGPTLSYVPKHTHCDCVSLDTMFGKMYMAYLAGEYNPS